VPVFTVCGVGVMTNLLLVCEAEDFTVTTELEIAVVLLESLLADESTDEDIFIEDEEAKTPPLEEIELEPLAAFVEESVMHEFKSNAENNKQGTKIIFIISPLCTSNIA